MFTEKVEVENPTPKVRHSAGARMVMKLLDLKAQGKLDPSLQPILDEITAEVCGGH